MAIIDEMSENGGTLFVDNIKVKVSNQPKKRDTDAVSALEKHRRYVSEQPKAVPKSVDLLLKKQEDVQRQTLVGWIRVPGCFRDRGMSPALGR